MLRTISTILAVVMIFSSLPMFYVSVSAASAYDSDYAGGKAGDGKIYAKGLDISVWQGENFDFDNVKNAGYDFVIIRCGYSTSEDSMFDTYYEGAKAAGLDVGAYIYSYAESVSEAKDEANACLTWLQGKKFEYPIYFDYEDACQSSFSSSTSEAICMAFMDILADNGYLVGVYSMKARLESLPLSTICSRYEAWIAHYYDYTHESKDASYWSSYGMYQFTDRQYINGKGPYDANVCYKDYPSIVKKYGFNNYPVSSDTTTTEDTTVGTAYDSDYAGGKAGDGKIYAKGLDISVWQGENFDFANVKNSGYDFVIIRCGYSTSEDSMFDTYYEGAKAAGLDVGAYIYSYAESVSEAQAEANACLTWLEGKQFEYPIYFDYEDECQSSFSSATSQNICMAFMDILADNGYLVGVYSMKGRLETLPLSTICARYEAWIAHYYDYTHESKDASYWSSYGMYQFTDRQYINGKGPYDANVCYKDYPSIVKKYGFNNYAAEEESTPNVPAGAAYKSKYAGGAAGDGKVYAQGLDISRFQDGAINFQSVKDAGYDYVIIRCAYSNEIDSKFEEFYAEAKAVGLDVGAYIASTATTTSAALTEARACIKWLSGKTFEYPIYYACPSGLTGDAAESVPLAFMDKLASYGYLTGVLGSNTTLEALPLSTICAKYEAWIMNNVDDTHETMDSVYSSTYGMYQYTYNTYVDGLGPYDTNVCYKDYPAIVKKYGFNNVPIEVEEGTAYKSEYAGGAAGDGKVIAEGLDISRFQDGAIDFQSVKDAGYDYVIIRCAYSSEIDSKFEEFYAEAKAVGLDVGAYIASTATTTDAAVKEANACLEFIYDKTFEYPVYYVCPSGLTGDAAESVPLAFMDVLAKRGFLVGIFGSNTTLESLPLSTICAKYEAWVADCRDDNNHEAKDADYWSKYGMYQYSAGGYVGELGPYDVNVCYKDYPAIVKKYGFNNYAPSTETSYVIRFNANGGSGSMEQTTVGYNDSYTLPENEFTKTGYSFDSWVLYRASDKTWLYTDAEGNTGWYAVSSAPAGWDKVTYAPGEQVSKLLETDGDEAVFHPRWTLNNYKITYTPNGGTGTMSATEVMYNKSVNLAENTFTNGTRKFRGWTALRSSDGKKYYVSESGEKEWYKEGSQPSGWTKYLFADCESVKNLTAENNDTVKLYAQWSKGSYDIDYNANGGVGSMSSVNVTFEESYTLPECEFTRTGFRFTSWVLCRPSDKTWLYTDANGSTEWYKESTAPTGWNKVTYNPGDQVSKLIDVDGGKVVFYPRWSINSYTVSFVANGGTGTMSSINVIYGKDATLPSNTFTHSEKLFRGWTALRLSDGKKLFVSETGEKAWYKDGTQPSGYTKYLFINRESIKNLTDVHKDTVKLYAQWGKGSYVILYNANGGSGEMIHETVAFSESYTLPECGFTKTGYSFVAWVLKKPVDKTWLYTDANGNTGWYQEGSQPTGWTKLTYDPGEQVSGLTDVNGQKVIFHPRWAVNNYKISFSKNGGVGSMTSIETTYANTLTLPTNTFTYAGKIFKGWTAARSSDGKKLFVSTDGTKAWYKDGTQPSGWKKYLFSDGEKVRGISEVNNDTVRLYANWQSNSYTIKYVSNVGDGTMDDTIVTLGTKAYLNKNAFTHTDYVFSHWTANRSSDDKWLYKNAKGLCGWYKLDMQPSGWEIFELTDGRAVSNLTKVNDDIIYLNANWSKNEYTIVYDSNGGTGSMSNTTVEMGKWEYLNANTFTNSGMTFAGWTAYRESDGKYFYQDAKGRFGWYKEGSQPSGSELYVLADKRRVKDLTAKCGDTIKLYANWSNA